MTLFSYEGKMGFIKRLQSWGKSERLPRYYMAATDDWVRREVLLALGKGNQQYWLRGNKNQVDQMTPWEKRAFIYSASCMPRDEV
jgi:hypothetical protein